MARRSNFKWAVANALKTELLTTLNTLNTTLVVEVGQQDLEKDVKFPVLSILPQTLNFLSWNPISIEDNETEGYEIYEVGNFEGEFILSLTVKQRIERQEIEQAIIDAFNQEIGASGRLIGSVPNYNLAGVATLLDAPCCFSIDDTEWQDEEIFSKKRDSQLKITVQYPAYVIKQDIVGWMNTLVLAINHDLESDIPEEEVEIDGYGGITRVV